MAKKAKARSDSFKAQLSDYMRTLGKKGGKASGAKRIVNLTAEQRREIASAAAKARWKKVKDDAPKA